jgi:DNA (cytosine-5)-methyltransferase 1
VSEPILFGSLFSGCKGMDSGLESAGMVCAWQVEIDPQCSAVLRYHDPNLPRFSDIKETSKDDLSPVHLIAGGSPCQDLSVAGTRTGLDGERSGLFHELVRVVDSQPAAWVLWENVDGALSSNGGADFGIVLRELSGFWPSAPRDGWRSAGFCVGPKRWCVWRVLDSEYFGVAQRRYRVFLVAGPRNGTCCPEVLLEPDCLPGNPPPSREAGAGPAGALTSGASGSGGWRAGADEAAAGQIVLALTGCGVGASGADDNQAQAGHLVAHTLCGEGFDASEDGTGRGTPIVAVARPLTTRPGLSHDETTDTLVVSRCLSTRGGQRLDFESETLVPIPYHLAQITSGENRSNPQPGDPAPALNGDPRLAIAFQERGREGGRSLEYQEELAYALTTGGVPFIVNAAESTAKVSHARQSETARALDSTGGFAASQGGTVVLEGGLPPVASTLKASHQPSYDAAGDGPGPVNFIPTSYGVRRLTPRECERLQGYPDDFTRYGIDRKGTAYELKDSPRYRMIGNGVTKPVATWIAGRIVNAMRGEACS